MPCHHSLEEYLTAYLEQTGIMDDGKGPLFRPCRNLRAKSADLKSVFFQCTILREGNRGRFPGNQAVVAA